MTKRKRSERVRSGGLGESAPVFNWKWWHLVLILASVWLVYQRSLNNGFTNWDDQEYIVSNADLADPSLHKHFVERPEVMGNFHPLTMLTLAWSYTQAKDPRTGVLNAKVFHVTDLVLHLLSALLVYLLILRLSANGWVALFTALLFGVHPMHVESVVWASERKDVLHVFFTLAAMACYAFYLNAKAWWWLLGAFACFVLAVLSKAMAVSLVPVLFLIDYHQSRKWSWRLFLEKLPFIALAIWAGSRAVSAQRAFESVQDLDIYPLWQRLLFACYGLMQYAVKFFVPSGLSAFHSFPTPGEALPWPYWIAPMFVLVSCLALWRWRSNKDLIFGIGFFLVTVFLVLQLLPVGGAVIAERYTYLPYVGLAFAFISPVVQWMSSVPSRRTPVLLGLCVFVVILSFTAQQRTLVWKDGVTLWTDAFAKDDRSPKILNNLGVALTAAERNDEALAKLDAAIALKTDYADAYYNRGLAKYYLGKHPEAIADFTRAIELRPELAVAWFNRAGTYFTVKRPDLALPDALKAQELGYAVDPQFIEVLRRQMGTNP